MTDTIVDFFRMVWQEGVQTIVMLTNIMENGVSKCEQYWPLLVSQETTFEPFTVELAKEEMLLDYVIRSFVIKV